MQQKVGLHCFASIFIAVAVMSALEVRFSVANGLLHEYLSILCSTNCQLLPVQPSAIMLGRNMHVCTPVKVPAKCGPVFSIARRE